jgi:hypothetical protein
MIEVTVQGEARSRTDATDTDRQVTLDARVVELDAVVEIEAAVESDALALQRRDAEVELDGARLRRVVRRVLLEPVQVVDRDRAVHPSSILGGAAAGDGGVLALGDDRRTLPGAVLTREMGAQDPSCYQIMPGGRRVDALELRGRGVREAGLLGARAGLGTPGQCNDRKERGT